MPKFNDIAVTRDHILFREGEIADKIYIITSGNFVVSKKTQSSQHDNENVHNIIDDPSRHRVMSNIFLKKNCEIKTTKNVLSIMQKGKMLGDVDILESLESEDAPKYSFTVKCIS